MSQSFASLEVTGIEVEYPVVGPDFRIRRIVPAFLEHLAGKGASDAQILDAGVSNEFVDHLLELKNEAPLDSLAACDAALAGGVRRAMEILEERFGASLLPGGMHPTLRPTEAQRWAGEGSEIYETYARLFDVVQHGWTNVQACHVNLPFGSESECCRLMNAVAMLIPYLPAISATSPIREGKVAFAVDQRLYELVDLQGRVPESKGRVVPEYMTSFAQYEAEVLEPMYRAVDRLDNAAILREEFFNSRGAILRFDRDALEVRVIDVQECPKMDVAMAAVVRASVRWLMSEQKNAHFRFPRHDALVADYRATVERGRDAEVVAPHLEGGILAGDTLMWLLNRSRPLATPDERPYLDLAMARLERGSLSEQIRRKLRLAPGTEVPASILERLNQDLQSALRTNTPLEFAR